MSNNPENKKPRTGLLPLQIEGHYVVIELVECGDRKFDAYLHRKTRLEIFDCLPGEDLTEALKAILGVKWYRHTWEEYFG